MKGSAPAHMLVQGLRVYKSAVNHMAVILTWEASASSQLVGRTT